MHLAAVPRPRKFRILAFDGVPQLAAVQVRLLHTPALKGECYRARCHPTRWSDPMASASDAYMHASDNVESISSGPEHRLAKKALPGQTPGQTQLS